MRRFFRARYDDDDAQPSVPTLPADPTVEQLVVVIDAQENRIGRLQRAYERFGIRMVWAWTIVVAAVLIALVIGTFALVSLGDKQTKLDAATSRATVLAEANRLAADQQIAERRRNTIKRCISDDRQNAAFIGFLNSLLPKTATPQQRAMFAVILGKAKPFYPTITTGLSKKADKVRLTTCTKAAQKIVKPAPKASTDSTP